MVHGGLPIMTCVVGLLNPGSMTDISVADNLPIMVF